jgi:signal transduction histidine kinase/ligand-binding sensor domain-containing protein/DNA-binding response OmpR family regulator
MTDFGLQALAINMKIRNLILSILCMYWSCAFAQLDQYQFTRIDVTKGLSHNQIKSILRDSRGFLWFGTISGLNRYDGYTIKVYRNNPRDTSSIISSDVNEIFEGPEGRIWLSTWSGQMVYDPVKEIFDRNVNRILKGLSIPEGAINNIKKDSYGDYWFIHATQGLFRYKPSTKKTISLAHVDSDSATVASNQISAIAEDHDGNMWVIHNHGVIEKINLKTLKVVYRHTQLDKNYNDQVPGYNFIVDKDNDLWIYADDTNRGVFYFETSKKRLVHIDNTTSKPRLNTDIVRGIVEDNNGLIWVATDHGGLNVIDKDNFTVRYVMHNEEDEKSLSQNSINVIFKDQEGIIWIGTYKNGVAFYHPNIIRFHLNRHQPSDTNTLPFNDINAVAEDEKGNLYFGSNGGGLIYYDRAKNKYKQYLNQPGNANSLSTNVIVSLFFDLHNVLWVGTYFGGLNSFDGKKFTRYKHDPSNPKSISDNSVWEIYEDSQDNLWVGTLSQGVDLFDRKRNEFYHYHSGDANSIHANYITSFIEDRQGNIWIGTGYGIDVLEKQSGRFIHYINQNNDPSSLSNNGVLALIEDSRGFIWLGTHGGLNLFDKATKTFRVFNEEDGLPHNSILTLKEDDKKNLWVSTPHGISNVLINYNPGQPDSLKLNFKNYDEADGLQGRQFNENAAFKTSKGELIFGGVNGFNFFRPEDIGINENKPNVILTDFQIFNKTVKIGEEINGDVILHETINQTKSITLKHDDNVFSIEFTTLSFFHPEKSQYKYKLEHFNKDWTTTDATQRRVTYTNLDPGEYVFKVKAANNEGIWNETPATLTITILPPFWKTKTAFVLYALFVLGALLLARWLILSKERMNYKIQQEREEAHRMHELDMMKIKFFTNVSHEFRTPLTLILTPLDKILKNTVEGDQKNHFQLIHRNAKRLLNLVNQLLDFRKMEVQEINFNPSEGDIVRFINDVVSSFSDLSEKKNIQFSFQSTVQQLETLFDQDKLEKILFNLLSNAFKFTPENGSVAVSLDVKINEVNKWLEIVVQDSGIGIPKDKHEKIFERFFQNDLPKSMVNQGSGIGLSITKEFVKIHGGSISVESEPEKGSRFTVVIPLTEILNHVSAENTDFITLASLDHEEELHKAQEHAGDGKKPILLLVEDNEDFRFYLKDNLKGLYAIIEARNGREGLERALNSIPDLIVSDVMMPEMNGIEFCRRIKTDQRTSHIPVILLTARTAEEQKLEGFETGANDYITKPFSFEILQSRIKNLIAQREAFQKRFNKHIEVKAGDVQITSLDEKLIQNAIKIVEDNLADADFSVENFSHELGMSRVHLYKKLLSLTGKSPLEFIRTIRLQRAAQLLEKSQLSVSEVAYKVGFNNPKYFTKYFKEQFNVLPSVYASAKR